MDISLSLLVLDEAIHELMVISHVIDDEGELFFPQIFSQLSLPQVVGQIEHVVCDLEG